MEANGTEALALADTVCAETAMGMWNAAQVCCVLVRENEGVLSDIGEREEKGMHLDTARDGRSS